MKRFIIVLIGLCGIALLSIYFFIPDKIDFAKVVYIQSNISIANRFISDEAKWNKWWPGEKLDSVSSRPNAESHWYKKYVYTITRKMYEGMDISIGQNVKTISSFLQIVALRNDSVVIKWKGEMPETNNIFKKIKNYFEATSVKNNISDILLSAKKFLENKESVYELKINQEKVKDTILITTKSLTKTYPEASEIYVLIKKLKSYTAANGAEETNYPMLNIMKDSGLFRTMVAIPVNKIIPETKDILLKRMVPGKILVAEVKGGSSATEKGLEQVETYMNDNHLQSPAIYFESLVTNRMEEPDTAKWVTKIYYPIF